MGYQMESFVNRAAEIGIEALIKIPTYGMIIMNDVIIPYRMA